MKVQMLETYQGVGQSARLLHEEITVTILQKGEGYVVDNVLGNWLVDNGKAVEIQSAAPAKQAAPAPAEIVPDEPQDEPMMSTKSHDVEKPRQQRSRRAQ